MKHPKTINLLSAILLFNLTAAAQYSLTATVYHPGRGGLSWHTADGSKIDKSKLQRQELRWVALSHDMLKIFDFGDTLEVECDNARLNGYWIVKDKMHKKARKRIDFMFPLNADTGLNRPIKVNVKKKSSPPEQTAQEQIK